MSVHMGFGCRHPKAVELRGSTSPGALDKASSPATDVDDRSRAVPSVSGMKSSDDMRRGWPTHSQLRLRVRMAAWPGYTALNDAASCLELPSRWTLCRVYPG